MAFHASNFECPVCREVFQNPQILECLHTVCKNCCDAIQSQSANVTNGGRTRKAACISCPECRATTPVRNIKLDFKMNALVSEYTASLDSQRRKLEESGVCDMCDLNSCAWFCEECSSGRGLCDVCRASHRKMATTQRHNVVKLSEKASALKKRVRKLEGQVRVLNSEVKEEQSKQLLKLSTAVRQEMNSVDLAEHQTINMVQEFYNSQRSFIVGVEEGAKGRLNEIFRPKLAHLHDLSQLASAYSDTVNLKQIVASFPETHGHMENSLRGLRTAILAGVDVSFTKENWTSYTSAWDEGKALSVKAVRKQLNDGMAAVEVTECASATDRANTTATIELPAEGSLVMQLVGCRLKRRATAVIGGQELVHKLIYHNGFVYCLTTVAILKYDPRRCLAVELSRRLRMAKSFAIIGNGDFIVATRKHLCQFNETNSFFVVIDEGWFADVTCSGPYVAAIKTNGARACTSTLHHPAQRIPASGRLSLMFSCRSRRWTRTTLSRWMPMASCLCAPAGITSCMCSYWNHVVYEIHVSSTMTVNFVYGFRGVRLPLGQSVHNCSIAQTQLVHPKISQMDRNGCMLIADTKNNCLKVLRPTSKASLWRKVDVAEPIPFLINACLADDNRLFVVNLSDKRCELSLYEPFILVTN